MAAVRQHKQKRKCFLIQTVTNGVGSSSESQKAAVNLINFVLFPKRKAEDEQIRYLGPDTSHKIISTSLLLPWWWNMLNHCDGSAAYRMDFQIVALMAKVWKLLIPFSLRFKLVQYKWHILHLQGVIKVSTIWKSRNPLILKISCHPHSSCNHRREEYILSLAERNSEWYTEFPFNHDHQDCKLRGQRQILLILEHRTLFNSESFFSSHFSSSRSVTWTKVITTVAISTNWQLLLLWSSFSSSSFFVLLSLSLSLLNKSDWLLSCLSVVCTTKLNEPTWKSMTRKEKREKKEDVSESGWKKWSFELTCSAAMEL